jgi:hypothetical protein
MPLDKIEGLKRCGVLRVALEEALDVWGVPAIFNGGRQFVAFAHKLHKHAQ